MKSRLFAPAMAAVLGLTAAPALAQNAAQEPELQVFRDTDGGLTCVQISDEAAALSEQMSGSQGQGVFGRLTGVARTGAAMIIPGAGLAMAGVDVLTQPERERREARAAAISQRWYYLNGLYTGLRCQQQAEAAEAASSIPAPAAAPAVSSAPGG